MLHQIRIVRIMFAMKTLTAHKKASREDWHPADICAAVRKAGWSLRRLSTAYGYVPQRLAVALSRPDPQGERLIAAALGTRPEVIWPSRYDRHGQPNRGRKLRQIALRVPALLPDADRYHE